MGIEFTAQESAALYGLLAEHTTDVIIKTDRDGFIRHASPGIERLGLRLHNQLILPRLPDLVDPASAPAIEAAHEAALAGKGDGDWIEFSAGDGGGTRYAVKMHGLRDNREECYGVLGIMRCVDEMRTLEERLFAAEMTDPLTGLTNRRAFLSMLDHLVGEQATGCLALFDIDRFRAFNLRHGQSEGDRVLVAFAEFLRGMSRARDIVSRVDGESFGILFPDSGPENARTACRRIVETLAGLGAAAEPDQFSITASAGLTPIGASVDATLRAAELALFFAKAKGRNGLEIASGRWPE